MDTITTDARGIANSKDLPIGMYGIKEVQAPEFYATYGKVFYAQIRAAKDLIRFEVQNKSEIIEVSVEKRGNVEVVAGDQMRYDFSNIQNKSNIDLDDFFWHDQLPAEVRLERIYTGTWSQKLSYKVLYRTNHKKDYKVLADKLSTQTETELDCTKEALGLAADEYVTDVKFEFGLVEPGFHETSGPSMVVTTLSDLPDQHRVTNRTDVGGRTGDEWIYAKDTWITIFYGKPKGSIETTQEVEIYFNFVGRYIPPHFGEVNLTPEEQEALRKKEERKDKLHQAYLRRKESGWQREYYERIKTEKRQKMEAKKAALRAEDMAKGVFYIAGSVPQQEPQKGEQKSLISVG